MKEFFLGFFCVCDTSSAGAAVVVDGVPNVKTPLKHFTEQYFSFRSYYCTSRTSDCILYLIDGMLVLLYINRYVCAYTGNEGIVLL